MKNRTRRWERLHRKKVFVLDSAILIAELKANEG